VAACAALLDVSACALPPEVARHDASKPTSTTA
jgi:hypothetical protein